MSKLHAPELLDALKALDTCTVANAIEKLDERLRNEGFTNQSIRRLTPATNSLVGYAATLRVHCSRPPMRGHAYSERTDWWDYVLELPWPRVIVIEDADREPGKGAFLGEIHAHILQALGCVGGITNGSVRDLPAVAETGFQLFGGGLALSHAYTHIIDFGAPVEVGGLHVKSGDLLHGDIHGIVSIPPEIASQIPAVVNQIRDHERRLIALCQAPDFSTEKLRAAVASA